MLGFGGLESGAGLAYLVDFVLQAFSTLALLQKFG